MGDGRVRELPGAAVRVPGLTSYNGEVYQSVLANLLGELEAAYVCSAHSSQGMDFSPALAVKLNAACITGVEDIKSTNLLLCLCYITEVCS